MISKFRFPPLIIVFVFCALMGLANFYFPTYHEAFFLRLMLSLFFIVIGVLFVAFGVIQFKSNKTTINPYRPESSTALVKTGVYSISRNPMYVGFVLVLISSACIFTNVISFILVFIFFLYMNYVQIPIEEKALIYVFGESYLKYKTQVSRWL